MPFGKLRSMFKAIPKMNYKSYRLFVGFGGLAVIAFGIGLKVREFEAG
jgi:hypothetical protein